MQVRKGGAWREITSGAAYINGAWRTFTSAKVYLNGAWRSVFTPTADTGGDTSGLSLALSSTSIRAFGSRSSLTTNSVTVTPTGGVAPYSYVWTIASDDGAASYSITAPNFATTAVSETGLAAGTSSGCSIQCVVTDSSGLSATTTAISASFTNTGA